VLIVVRSSFRRHISPRSVLAIDGNNLTLPVVSSLRSSYRPAGQLIALFVGVLDIPAIGKVPDNQAMPTS